MQSMKIPKLPNSKMKSNQIRQKQSSEVSPMWDKTCNDINISKFRVHPKMTDGRLDPVNTS